LKNTQYALGAAIIIAFNLSDGVLIKDNHIAACGSIVKAVQVLREKVPHTIKIEVETDTLDQVHECLECHADIIMLDNMDLDTMKQAVSMIGERLWLRHLAA